LFSPITVYALPPVLATALLAHHSVRFVPFFKNGTETAWLFPLFLKIMGQKEIPVNLPAAIDFLFFLFYNEA